MVSEHLTKFRPVTSVTNRSITRGSDNLGKQQLGAVYDNTGATGAVTYTLPVDAEPGDIFYFDVVAAQGVIVYGGTTGVFTHNGSAGTAGQSLRQSGVAGASIQVMCTGPQAFRTRQIGGTWTVS